MRLSSSPAPLLCSLLFFSSAVVQGDRVFGTTSMNNRRMDHAWKNNLSARQPSPIAVDDTSKVPQVSRGGEQKDQGKASIAASVFNLVNNVAGAGILTLSAGMAGGTGWIPAISICTILGVISAHCFSIIGESCELTGEKTFKVRSLVNCFLSFSFPFMNFSHSRL